MDDVVEEAVGVECSCSDGPWKAEKSEKRGGDNRAVERWTGGVTLIMGNVLELQIEILRESQNQSRKLGDFVHLTSIVNGCHVWIYTPG